MDIIKEEEVEKRMRNRSRTAVFAGIVAVAAVSVIAVAIHFSGLVFGDASDNIKAIGDLNPQGKYVEIDVDSQVQAPASTSDKQNEPQVKVPYDLESVKKEQESVDQGHQPWKLDPAFVAQVFVSLKIKPEGIVGDYPIPYEAFKIIQNDGKEAIIQVESDKSPVSKVYLKRLVKQDETGIWTVVGYDPAK